MLKKNKGFTLAELLIALAVCASLAAIIMPAIAYIRPDKKKVMFKKAYYVAERMVYELANDEDFYPTTGETVGLANTIQTTYLGHTYGSSSNESKQKGKFCSLFARKVNTNEDLTYNKGVLDVCKDASRSVPSGNGTYTTPTFVTTDGISWYLPYTDFKSANYNDTDGAKIYVDVNGDEGPNCINSHVTDCKPDIFIIHVMADGKMYVKGDKEKEYLSTSKLSKDRGK